MAFVPDTINSIPLNKQMRNYFQFNVHNKGLARPENNALIYCGARR